MSLAHKAIISPGKKNSSGYDETLIHANVNIERPNVSPPDSRLDLASLSQQLSEASVPLLREFYRLMQHDLALALLLGELGRTNAGQRLPSPNHNQSHDLSLATGIPRPTVRRKLVKLKRMGWLEADKSGRLTLTPWGREQWADINRRFWARARQALARVES